MQYSYSRTETYKSCPYKFKLRYIDNLLTLPPDEADNPLILGSAMHLGIEADVQTAIDWYYGQFPIITDKHINEVIKLEALIPKAQAALPKGRKKFEVEIETDIFHGFADLITGKGDIYDFKYASKNNFNKYLDSGQLRLYRHFRDLNCDKVNKLFYLFIPKCYIRQKKTETLYQFRQRLRKELEIIEVQVVEINYSDTYIDDFYKTISDIELDTEFKKTEDTSTCDWCEYKNFCKEGLTYMILPNTARRVVGATTRRRIWIYGAPFSGKTTMLDSAPNPLNLNTDGNVAFVTMPFVALKDEITTEGRITKRKYAWEIFKETIEELEKKQNNFETIILDLVEDTREMCRLYKYNELGIEHESDSGYGKGWDIIKTEFLSTMRRLMNLDYPNVILVSHEDISKDITKKNGQTITRIAPNIQESIANKLAGMVDIVARVIVEDDGTRTLNFKSNEVIFGGGRLTGIKETSIPLDWDELVRVYNESLPKQGKETPKTKEPVTEPPTGANDDIKAEPKERKTRKKRS